jgi:hypothetical protein
VVPNFFHLRMMEFTVLGDLQCCRHFWYLYPDLCLDTTLSQSSTDNFFDLMSNQLNLPQVDFNQVVEPSMMINGNRMHLSSISSLIAKGLNTYVNKACFFFAKKSFALSIWGIVCRLLSIFYIYLIHFIIRL